MKRNILYKFYIKRYTCVWAFLFFPFFASFCLDYEDDAWSFYQVRTDGISRLPRPWGGKESERFLAPIPLPVAPPAPSLGLCSGVLSSDPAPWVCPSYAQPLRGLYTHTGLCSGVLSSDPAPWVCTHKHCHPSHLLSRHTPTPSCASFTS